MPASFRALLPLLAGAAAVALLLVTPTRAEAQGERPSIRISGGHVYIGGRHAGSIGAGRDHHAAGRLIRGRLLEMGDPRAARFGPGRLGDRSGFTRHPRWIHPRTIHPRGTRPRLTRPHLHPPRAAHPFHLRPGHRGHPGPGAGFVFVLHHPFGAVLVAHQIYWWRWVESTSVAVGVATFAAPEGDAQGVGEPFPETPAEGPRPRARPAPYEPPSERCADVTVGLLAGAGQRVRVDMATLGAETAAEVRAALVAQLEFEGRLDVRGSRGDGLVTPAALIRSLDVAPCPSD